MKWLTVECCTAGRILGIVAEYFKWRKKWDKVIEWNFKEPRQVFDGAKLNITENCLDRHLEGIGDQPDIIWEPNDPSWNIIVFLLIKTARKVCSLPRYWKRNNGCEEGRSCLSNTN